MKKRTILILTLISIIAMVAGTAMAPAEGRSVRYLGARFINGKGAVFLFEYTGSISKAELKSAFAYGNGGDPLSVHCVDKKEVSQIACTVSKANRYTEITLGFMGQGFGAVATVPQPKQSLECLGFQSVLGSYEPFSFFASLPSSYWDNIEGAGYSRDMTGMMDYYDNEGSPSEAIADRCVTDASLFNN